MTVLEAIQKTAAFFAARGIESARLQAELLLAHVLQQPRMRLYLSFDRVLTGPEVDAFRELVRRRGQREPLQHLLGSVSFCGLELAVGPAALIPRPETEELARLGWEFLSARPEPVALDWGTGTGCLAIAIAIHCPAATVVAVDLSEPALELARANLARHQLQNRVNCLASDGFAAVPAGMQFDLLVSNPPYIATAEIAALQPEVRDHDPRLALDGGTDGLDVFRRLAAEAAPWLKPDGRIMLEFGDGQAGAVSEIFTGQNWVVEAVVEDYSRRSRFLVARRT
ncbi:MAG: peptide chain release factor N(5)-glutamine methyltransferase [Limisphaerales bacterium]